MLAVFVARFVAGLRFMAGPLAGSTGLDPWRFFVANLLGAMIYVPVIVGLGYGVGYGLGHRIEELRHAARQRRARRRHPPRATGDRGLGGPRLPLPSSRGWLVSWIHRWRT